MTLSPPTEADLAKVCELLMFDEGDDTMDRDTLRDVPTTLLASKENIKVMFGVLPESEHGLISTGIWESGMTPFKFVPGWPTLLPSSLDPFPFCYCEHFPSDSSVCLRACRRTRRDLPFSRFARSHDPVPRP